MSGRRRGNRIKKTVVYRGLFGEKHVETRWVDEGNGCGRTPGTVPVRHRLPGLLNRPSPWPTPRPTRLLSPISRTQRERRESGGPRRPVGRTALNQIPSPHNLLRSRNLVIRASQLPSASQLYGAIALAPPHRRRRRWPPARSPGRAFGWPVPRNKTAHALVGHSLIILAGDHPGPGEVLNFLVFLFFRELPDPRKFYLQHGCDSLPKHCPSHGVHAVLATADQRLERRDPLR
jgi:hypothetical protein